MSKKREEKGIYNVKAISKKLGIQPGTLRAWERRYQIVTPKRNEVGHRIYTEHDLTILKWLVDKVNQGFTISQAVDLLSEQNQDSPSLFSSDEVLNVRKEEIAQNIFNSLIEFNEKEAANLVDYALSLYRIEVVLFDILTPILNLNLYIPKNITDGQIQFVRSWLKLKILSIYQQIPVYPYLAKVITLTPANESDEIKVLMFSIFLKLRGFEVYYFGQIDIVSLQALLSKLDPSFIFSVETNDMRLSKQLLPFIKDQFSGIQLGVIGKGTESYNKEIYMGNELKEWEDWINNHLHIGEAAVEQS